MDALTQAVELTTLILDEHQLQILKVLIEFHIDDLADEEPPFDPKAFEQLAEKVGIAIPPEGRS